MDTLPVVSGKFSRQLSKSISKTKDDASLRTGLLSPPKGIGFPPKLCWRYFLWKITGRAFLQVLLQAQPPAVTDRPGSPARSQRLSSSPLSDKRGFENEGTAKLRRAGTSGPLWVFASLIPAHAGRRNAMRTQNGIRQKSNDLQPLSPSWRPLLMHLGFNHWRNLTFFSFRKALVFRLLGYS